MPKPETRAMETGKVVVIDFFHCSSCGIFPNNRFSNMNVNLILCS